MADRDDRSVTRQPPGRFRGNACAVLELGAAEPGAIGLERVGIDMQHDLVALGPGAAEWRGLVSEPAASARSATSPSASARRCAESSAEDVSAETSLGTPPEQGVRGRLDRTHQERPLSGVSLPCTTYMPSSSGNTENSRLSWRSLSRSVSSCRLPSLKPARSARAGRPCSPGPGPAGPTRSPAWPPGSGPGRPQRTARPGSWTRSSPAAPPAPAPLAPARGTRRGRSRCGRRASARRTGDRRAPSREADRTRPPASEDGDRPRGGGQRGSRSLLPAPRSLRRRALDRKPGRGQTARRPQPPRGRARIEGERGELDHPCSSPVSVVMAPRGNRLQPEYTPKLATNLQRIALKEARIREESSTDPQPTPDPQPMPDSADL